MNYNNKGVSKVREHIYEFLHFDRLSCQILAQYYGNFDMILEFELDKDYEEISFEIRGYNIEICWNNINFIWYLYD